MPNRKPTDIRRGETPEKQFDWFKTAASQPSQCDDWDVKTELLAEAVLGLLSLGKGIMLGTTRDGTAIALTLYDGDNKSRKYIGDAIDFDDAMSVIVDGVRTMKERSARREERVAGD